MDSRNYTEPIGTKIKLRRELFDHTHNYNISSKSISVSLNSLEWIYTTSSMMSSFYASRLKKYKKLRDTGIVPLCITKYHDMKTYCGVEA
jgi:hypothetical protein